MEFVESVSFVKVNDEKKLRYLINAREKNLEEYYNVMSVKHFENEEQPYSVPLEQLETQLEYQKNCVDKAIKFKYLVGRITQQHKVTPVLQYLIHAVNKHITAECNLYQVLPNHLELKKSIVTHRKEKKQRRKRNKYTQKQLLDVDWA